MMKLPFFQHGFNVYDIDQWSSVLQSNGFDVFSIARSLDLPVEIEGDKMRMESICAVSG